MIAFLNGQFVPEEQAVVSVFDRSFLYGDGLFETMLVCHGKPFRLEQHLERLQRGAEFLKMRLPYPGAALQDAIAQLIRRNQASDGILRLTVSRGVGPRGFSPKGADRPVVVMTLHPAPPGIPEQSPRWRLITAPFRLPARDALARFKTCNKLPQIMARAEADDRGADEALLLNTDGQIVEAASSNLFWISDGVVCTPPIGSGILAGVTRAVVLEICASLGIPNLETGISPDALRAQDGVFFSLSTLGVVEAVSLDGHELRRSPMVETLRERYGRLVQAETARTGSAS